MDEGKIKYFGGKPEFLARGYFDDVDIAFMVHTTAGKNFSARFGSVGCLAKRIVYKGVAAHAGGMPWSGKNALYAATCGLNACNALRETFKEADIIRFHPIMTHGGDMVNAIPESATIESYVRGATFEAMVESNKRLNQALIGAALSLDNNIEIIDKSGYAPLYNDLNMIDLAKDAYKELYPDREFVYNPSIGSGSTDMGDLCCVMPVVHPYASGATGTSHGNNYYIEDPEQACVDSAKWQLNMLLQLTKDEAKLAKKIISEYKPMFKNKEEYIEYCNKLNCSGNRIDYNGDQVTIKL